MVYWAYCKKCRELWGSASALNYLSNPSCPVCGGPLKEVAHRGSPEPKRGNSSDVKEEGAKTSEKES